MFSIPTTRKSSMPQDRTPDPDPQPVIHVTQWPRYANQSDGSVRAYYPGEDWFVTGADQDDARTKLQEESERRMADPSYWQVHAELTQRHLNGEVTPGFEVNTISQADYQRRTTELGDQLRQAD
jgi:hypothetical protein